MLIAISVVFSIGALIALIGNLELGLSLAFSFSLAGFLAQGIVDAIKEGK